MQIRIPNSHPTPPPTPSPHSPPAAFGGGRRFAPLWRAFGAPFSKPLNLRSVIFLEFDVKAICFDVGVSRGEATEG